MPVFAPETVLANETFDKNGVVVGTRSKMNLVEGANAALTITDNASQNRVDVTLSSVTTSFQSVLLALGPASYWKLDETSGTTASDVNSLVNGTYVGSPTLGQASLISSGGTSVSIGSGKGVNLGSSTYGFAGIASYSWVALINVAAMVAASSWQTALDRTFVDGAGRQGYAIAAWFDAGPNYQIYTERWLNGARTVAQSASGAYALGATQFISVTYSGAALTLYVGGASIATTPDTRSLVAASSVLALGNSPSFTGNHYLNGLLDEVAVFTRALSLSEISSLYSASL